MGDHFDRGQLMYVFILTPHVLTVMLVIGTLFEQSLTVVFRLRLSDP